MKKLLSTLLLLLLAVYSWQASSQEITWQNCYGSSQQDTPTGIIKTSFGTVIYTTIRNNELQVPNYHGDEDACLIALDTSGNLLWHRCYGGSRSDEFTKIVAADDNSYYALGESWSTDGDLTSIPESPMWLIKFDSNFNIIWQKRGCFSKFNEISDAVTTSDEGLLVLGRQHCLVNLGDKWFSFYSVYAAKLNNTGQEEWVNLILPGCADFRQDMGISLKRTTRKGLETYYLLAWKENSYTIILFEIDVFGGILNSKNYGWGSVTPLENGYIFNEGIYDPSFDYNINLIRVDSLGAILWQKNYGGSKEDYPGSSYPLPNGGFAVFSQTKSHDGDVKNHHWGISGKEQDIWVFTIDSVGNMLSSTCFGSHDKDEFRINGGIAQKSPYEFTITTTALANDGDISCLPFPGSKDIWTYNIKLCEVIYGPAPARPVGPPNVSTLITPQSSYSTTFINAAQEYEWSLLPNTAGTIMQEENTVTITWTPGFQGNVALYARYAPECGHSAWSEAHYIQVRTSTGISDNEQPLLRLWPNPSLGELNVEVPSDITLPATLLLSNTQGETVFSQIVDQPTQIIDLSFLPSGLYFYQLQSTELNIVGKLLVTSNK